MSRLIGFAGATIGSWLGWWIGAWFGFPAAVLVSIVGMGVGLYVARRMEQRYL